MASKEGYMGFPRPLQRLAVASAVVLIALLGVTSASRAATPRAPQIPFCYASLQGYLDGVGEHIDVANDQINSQVWTTTISGNAQFTVMLERAGYAQQNTIGVYNGDDANPTLFQVFPGAATVGWFASLHFHAGALTVILFDNSPVPVFQGYTTYAGVDPNKFAFYLQGPGGTFYSQDYRNAGGNAQVLTYAGTGNNAGSWWQCFEDLPYQYPDCLTDFEDAVLFIESVNPVPARGQTWGGLKSIYR